MFLNSKLSGLRASRYSLGPHRLVQPLVGKSAPSTVPPPFSGPSAEPFIGSHLHHC